MSDVPIESQEPRADPEEGWSEDTSLQAETRELFVTLGKALRAYQLYDENNPVYQRFVTSLREAFSALWQEVDSLRVRVEEDRLLASGEEVYRSESHNESLAFLFYKDGVREITFVPGIEGEELERFLSVLQRARHIRPEGDDLLTILWEEDLRHFHHQYVDLLAEGVELPRPGERHGADELKGVLQGELSAEEEEEASREAGPGDDAPRPQTVSQEDFNPTLYSLDPREMQRLQEEVQREMARDLRSDVLSALFDRIEDASRPERQSEILTVFRSLLPNFLSRGLLGPAGRVLHELSQVEKREGVFDQDRKREVGALLDEVSAPQAIGELVSALEDETIAPAPDELRSFLSHLRADALAPLLHATESVENARIQAALREAVKGIADRNRASLSRLFGHEDAVVVAGAARLAGAMGVTEAGPALAGLTRHRDPNVRLAAVEAAVGLRASTVAGALQDLLDDPERDVRIAAARALGALSFRPAAKIFRDALSSKEIRRADISEKIAFFESYGAVGDSEAVELLDKLLNGKGFLGRREPAEIRACAALALGKVGTPEARAALQVGMGEEDPVVKSAVSRALRGGVE